MVAEKVETIGLRGHDGRVWATIPILRRITLRGVDGFCIHRYQDSNNNIDEYRVSHIDTGAYLTRGATDGEVFVAARRFDRGELETKISRTVKELDNLKRLQERGKI